MKLVVGLGNPGSKYNDTRHNVGFDVLEVLAKRYFADKARKKFKGKITEINVGGVRCLLLMPQTFMNLSGESVQLVAGFFQIKPSDILIICDDFNLALTQLRFRKKGSSGGQNGLADIIRRLGTDEIPRLRFGVGKPPANWNVADYVLSRFKDDERQTLTDGIERAANGVVDWLQQGMDHCMNQYNRKIETNKSKVNETKE